MRNLSERLAIIDHCLRMLTDDLTVATSGNVSIRTGERVLITPSGIDYDQLTPEMICEVDLAGAQTGGHLTPSVEVPMHLLIYRNSPDAGAVVHTHGLYSSAVSTLVEQTPIIHYMIGILGGPVRVAPYAPFGSQELADNVERAMEGRTGVLMANHGAVCWGADLHEAYKRATYLEWVCRLWLTAKNVGEPRLLSDEQLDAVLDTWYPKA